MAQVERGAVSGERDGAGLSYLETIPDEIFTHITELLDPDSILALQVNKILRSRVKYLVVQPYIANHPFHHITRVESSPSDLFRYNHAISSRIARRQWHSTQIGAAWPRAVIPVLSLDSDKLCLGVGGTLVVHELSARRSGKAKTIERGWNWRLSKESDGARGDIVGLAPIGDGQVIAAHYNGVVQRLDLRKGVSTARYETPIVGNQRKPAVIRNLAHDGDMFMITTETPDCRAHIYSARSPWSRPISLTFPPKETRAWSSLISINSKSVTPKIMLGLSNLISIHQLDPSSSKLTYDRSLASKVSGDQGKSSASYDMHLPPHDSGHHPTTLLSAWYDSHLSLHDLRSPSASPYTKFKDPLLWAEGSGFHSATWFGEYGIAGGGARHGTVCLFDVRYAKKGWSVYSPGGKGSPVYSLQGEGGRIWGVTEKRAFVLAFDGSGDYDQGILSTDLMREVRNDRSNNFRGSEWGRGNQNSRSAGDLVGKGYTHQHGNGNIELLEGIPTT